jgi:hypothetical protein
VQTARYVEVEEEEEEEEEKKKKREASANHCRLIGRSSGPAVNV